MSKEEIFERLKKSVADVLDIGYDMVTMDAMFEGYLADDSLDLVEITLTLEEQFGFELSEEEAQKLITVGDAVDYIYSLQLVGVSR